MNIKIEGLDKLMDAVIARGAKAKKECALAVADAGFKMSEEAVKNLADNHSVKTGTLAKSLGTDAIKLTNDDMTATIETNIKYAVFVEYGTDAHVIEAKNASVLTDGKNFFGKKVNHPGSKPKPYFRPAFEVARMELITRLKTLAND